jgi:hypothetical protein
METEQIVQTIRTRFDHDASKQQLREKYEAKLLFAHAGGMWRAGPELLVEVVLVDEYKNPVRVGKWELKHLAEQRWQEQMNGWLTEVEELSRQR